MAFNQRLRATSDRTEKRKTTVHCKFENVALSECVLMLIAAEGVCYQLEVTSNVDMFGEWWWYAVKNQENLEN